jgi:aspartyl-tRNA(Asn)/glutamyl-tRNA(Gln) amidotransferase subunit C
MPAEYILSFPCDNNFSTIIYDFASNLYFMLSFEEVQKISLLARLKLSDEEIKRYQKDLSNILEYAKTLNEVDTNNTEPLYQVNGLESIIRKDSPKKQTDQLIQDIVNASPQGKEDRQFLVKNIL